MTSDEHYRAPFEPLLPGVRFVPVNDPTALLAAVSRSTAAIIVEPIQGEGGVRPLTPAFAAAITEACVDTGALIIADEVQSGLGRTGYPFYCAGARPSAGSDLDRQGARRRRAGRRRARQREGRGHDRVRRSRQHLRRQPARLPRGALLPRRAGRAAACSGGSHGSAIISSEGFERWRPDIRSSRKSAAPGLIWGLELTRDAAPVIQEGLARGVIVNRTAETVVRLLPPLVITEPEIDEALGRLDAAFGAVGADE